MCGIVGYVGEQQATKVLLAGLKHLEYRGYDSAGIALADISSITSFKKAGKLANLQDLLNQSQVPEATSGIGHTRWATHGAPNDQNAHPHLDEANQIAIIHNGIIENFASLRAELTAAGYKFKSETDTEVVAHLLAQQLSKSDSDLATAMRNVCQRLKGAFTLVAISATQPGLIVGARRNSPLVVGLGEGRTS